MQSIFQVAMFLKWHAIAAGLYTLFSPRGPAWLCRPCLACKCCLALQALSGTCPVSVLGRDKGYTVKYSPLPEGIHKENPKGTPKGVKSYGKG